ncbi:hypothetical protein GGX14DRAFT_409910 [Mycena pura]|uniref:Uncharacterized protein n=1 Tax=Mycena pura TaxID=153505 RepID=A0AAD6YVD4_9AGAR|nr:hypothetical protein GGX14DRAFT_409910 [Mycena pura]
MGIVISGTVEEDPSGGGSSTTVEPSGGSGSSSIIQTPGSYTFTTPEKLGKKLLDKIYDDIDTSSISKTHLALAITFAIYTVLPLLPVYTVLSKRVEGWYTNRLVEDAQLKHAQVRQGIDSIDAVTKLASGYVSGFFFLTLLFWLVYYVTEAVTAGGKGVIITTFEDYRFTTAQRYVSLAISDLIVLVMLLYVVNLRLTRIQKILFWLSFILTITVYACMLTISPNNSRSPSVAEAARILRHTESGIYLVLVVLVTRAIWKLRSAVARASTGVTASGAPHLTPMCDRASNMLAHASYRFYGSVPSNTSRSTSSSTSPSPSISATTFYTSLISPSVHFVIS